MASAFVKFVFIRGRSAFVHLVQNTVAMFGEQAGHGDQVEMGVELLADAALAPTVELIHRWEKALRSPGCRRSAACEAAAQERRGFEGGYSRVHGGGLVSTPRQKNNRARNPDINLMVET